MSSIKVHVGTPSSNFEDWTTAEVYFHGFADLTTTRDEAVVSPLFSCFGHQWRVDLYPGGDDGSDDGYVALDLCNMSNAVIEIYEKGFDVDGSREAMIALLKEKA